MYEKLYGLTYEDVKIIKELWQQREFEKFNLEEGTIYELNGGFFLLDYLTIDNKTGEGIARFIRYNQEGRYTIGRDSINLNAEGVKACVCVSDFNPSQEIQQLMEEIYDVNNTPLTHDERDSEIHKLENKIRDVVKACPHDFRDHYANYTYVCELCGYEYTEENNDSRSGMNINGIKVWN